MLDLIGNDVAGTAWVSAQVKTPTAPPETNPRFPFMLTLRNAYLVSKTSMIVETPSAGSNEIDGERLDSQRLMANTSPLREVKSIDGREETLTVKALQRWTGRVERVMKDRFVAIVSDVTTRSNPDEEVELDIEDVPLSDHGLITRGAVFYWGIVYRDSKAGQRWKTESIRFARHPKLSKEDVREIFREADAITAILESA